LFYKLLAGYYFNFTYIIKNKMNVYLNVNILLCLKIYYFSIPENDEICFFIKTVVITINGKFVFSLTIVHVIGIILI